MYSVYASARLETRIVITVVSISVVVIGRPSRSRIVGGFVGKLIRVVAKIVTIVASQIVVIVRDRVPVILRVPSTLIIT